MKSLCATPAFKDMVDRRSAPPPASLCVTQPAKARAGRTDSERLLDYVRILTTAEVTVLMHTLPHLDACVRGVQRLVEEGNAVLSEEFLVEQSQCSPDSATVAVPPSRLQLECGPALQQVLSQLEDVRLAMEKALTAVQKARKVVRGTCE